MREPLNLSPPIEIQVQHRHGLKGQYKLAKLILGKESFEFKEFTEKSHSFEISPAKITRFSHASAFVRDPSSNASIIYSVHFGEKNQCQQKNHPSPGPKGLDGSCKICRTRKFQCPVMPTVGNISLLKITAEWKSHCKGSRAVRRRAGFGASATKIKVRFVLRDGETGEELFRIDRQGRFYGTLSVVGGGKGHAVQEAAGEVVDGLVKRIRKII